MAVTFQTPSASAPVQTTLETLATSPQRVRNDEGTVEERPLPQVIEMDRYLKSQDATDGGVPYGLRIARTTPRGTV